MAIQTFTAGQVLTAAQMTALQANDYNQTVSAKTGSYVLTAADKGTRITMSSASATTITVNTALFAAGDSLRIQNLNGGGVCTVTAGTATVTSAGSLIIPSWGGGQLYFTSTSAAVWFPDAVTATPGGLVCVKAETAFSAVASFSADSIFTSSYTNYRMICRLTGTTGGAVSMQLRASTTPATSNYNYQRTQYGGGAVTTTRTTAAANFALGFGSTGSFTQSFWLELTGPQLAEATNFNLVFGQSDTSYAFPDYNETLGNNSNSTAYDGFAVSVATGTMTGTYTVYGYAKTV